MNGRTDRLGDIKGRTWLFSSCPKDGPRKEHTDSQADNKRHDSDPNRVHTTIVGVERALSDRLDRVYAWLDQAFGLCSRFVNHPHDSVYGCRLWLLVL